MDELRMYIDGQWVESESGAYFDAYNPANLDVIARVSQGTRKDAERAIFAAYRGLSKIARMPTWDRAKMLYRVADVMEARREDLARTLSEDQGKPYESEALPEVDMSISGFREAADLAKFLETSVIPVADGNKRVWSIRQPRGVYAIITPWNFPINIPVEYLAPGLAMGNTIVWVPAPTTSVCAVKLMECIEEADVPKGVVNLVTGPGPVAGDEIVRHPLTAAIGFTGSPQTGKSIAREGAGKPMLLELGGNGPTIVLDDADIPKACKAIAFACFFNAGQVCSATERIIVSPRIHDVFLEGLLEQAKQFRMGAPLDPSTTLGPLNNHAVAEKTDRHIEDSVSKGAIILYGGNRAPEFGSKLFYQPTVIDRVTQDMQFNREETFGPVAPIMVSGSDDEIMAGADSSAYGLVASVWTSDMKRAFYFAENLRAGIVTINENSDYWEPHIPFGGMSGKQSGVGRIGGRHTLEAMSDLKTIVLDLS
ncbi:MAG TPA: aldehyde dehydrogenase family protein [Acidobacteriota bacterium]|jgi:succinate-semialdehyde dehydrogenase/glutarate-semialdehyde dehydrogenase